MPDKKKYCLLKVKGHFEYSQAKEGKKLFYLGDALSCGNEALQTANKWYDSKVSSMSAVVRVFAPCLEFLS